MNRATVGHARSAIMPRVPRKWSSMVQHGPAKSRKVQHVPAMVPQIPATSRMLDVRDHAGPSTSIDHGIRARRRLAPQWRSSLTIAHRSLEEYITADPQREFEVRR